MPNNYQFLDAYGSVQTAASSIVSGAHQPIVQVASFLSAVPTIISGSILTSPSGNQSVSGTVNIGNIPSVSGTVGASIIGQLPAGTALLGSVATLQGSNPWIITGSVQGIGSVLAFQAGTQITSVISSNPSSLLTGASIFGQLPAGTAVLGSVATLQGTNPWITTFSNSSILTVPVGSTIVYLQSSSILSVPVGSTIVYLQAPSIVGTYAEDAGHTTADKGLFVLGVRNDAVASTASADLDYTVQASDSAGRTLTKPFAADETTFTAVGSLVSGSVTLLKASAIGKRNYVTDFWLANTGAANTLVTFQDGSTSILGYTIAPTVGGSNAPGIQVPFKTATAQDLALKMTTATSVLYYTVQGYQAP